MLRWVHFGDLHASADDGYRSLDHLKAMVASVNRHLSDRIDFAFLPGDNANNGTPEQFRRILEAVRDLRLPLYAIPGDHDFEPGHLNAFSAFSNSPLPMSRKVNGHRCLFLDVVAAGRGGPDFRLSAEDRRWLERELDQSASDPAPPVVFMHAYPADIDEGSALACAFAQANVAIVDTGHTHYNELINDGYVVYAATRSTGQIEEDEGQPGFSVVAVDGGSVSWKFHRLDAVQPFVMITRPCDWRLHRRRFALNCAPESPEPPKVRALIAGDDIVSVTADLDGMPFSLAPDETAKGMWEASIPSISASDRLCLTVTARTADGRAGVDAIELPSIGDATHPLQSAGLGSDAHAVKAWPEHGILGSQLGPNKHGRHW